MTRKDYKIIAFALQGAKESAGEGEGLATWHLIVENLVKALAKDNPRFNPMIFRSACKGV